MTENTLYDTVIIGGGPAGLSAGIYAGRSAMKTAIIESIVAGGQIATTDEIENYPGVKATTGPNLSEIMREQAEGFGVEFVNDEAYEVAKTDEDTFKVTCYGATYEAKTLIYTAGATPRPAGFDGEEKYKGRGVSYCATCDASFYKGKTVYVIGGGNSAVEEALYLTNFADKVIVLVRKDHFRAPQSIVSKLVASDKVEVRFNTKVAAVDGQMLLTSITLEDTVTHEQHTEEYEMGSFGIFVFVGHNPVTELIAPFVEIGSHGGILVEEQTMKTKTEGLYVAGDVREKKLRQVITAASDGAIAATSAYEYINF